MSEFTKEELQYIKGEIQYINDYMFKGAACSRIDKCSIIENKIQSMIDNYPECQHESDGNIYWDKARFPEKHKCLKCGEFYR